MTPNLTIERLRHILLYNPETGIFTWRVKRKKCRPGAQVGTQDDRGYWLARIDYRRYYMHRLAWFYMTGEWPPVDIDHRDQDKTNNRWSNLRLATPKQNGENGPIRSNNTSGAIGVVWHAPSAKWQARIKHHRVYYSLGYHTRFEDAVAARRAGELRFFTHSPACAPRDACLSASCETEPDSA